MNLPLLRSKIRPLNDDDGKTSSPEQWVDFSDGLSWYRLTVLAKMTPDAQSRVTASLPAHMGIEMKPRYFL